MECDLIKLCKEQNRLDEIEYNQMEYNQMHKINISKNTYNSTKKRTNDNTYDYHPNYHNEETNSCKKRKF